jgi:hypothetical protein
MQGNIEADLTAMSFEKIALLIGGGAFLLVLAAVIVVVLVRMLGVKSIGPIRLEQHGQSSMFSMNEANKELDDACRRQMREMTSKMKRHISNIFAELRVCTIARVAISSAIRYPMYESIANNHFTTELMPEQYGAYRERIIESMKDEYESLSAASMDLQCGRESLPSWDDVEKKLIRCVDLWLRNVSHDVMLCCEKKIAVYKSYLPYFEAAKDIYRVDIIKDCIERNRHYVSILKTRTSSGAL